MRITNWPQWYKIDWSYIEDEISEQELYEYEIRDREDLIDNLIDRISEATIDKDAMKEDLKLLINMNDTLILSSNRTNDYIDSNDENYNLHCNNILKLNKELWS